MGLFSDPAPRYVDPQTAKWEATPAPVKSLNLHEVVNGVLQAIGSKCDSSMMVDFYAFKVETLQHLVDAVREAGGSAEVVPAGHLVVLRMGGRSLDLRVSRSAQPLKSI